MNLLSPAAVWDNRFTTTEMLIAVPCGCAGSATNTHYDQDILVSATVWKKHPRFMARYNQILPNMRKYSQIWTICPDIARYGHI